jgi:hypothetical protein
MTPPAENNVTLAVLGERLNNVVTMLGEVRKAQQDQGDQLSGLPGLTARVDAMERWQTWALRTVLGVVIVAGVIGSATYIVPG